MPPLSLELGCIARVGSERVLVTVISLPAIGGYNVNTGAIWSGLDTDIDTVVARHYRAFINNRSQSTHFGNYFVNKVVQDSNGRIAICNAFLDIQVPVWNGIQLNGVPWSTTIKPTIVAENLGDYTTEQLREASARRPHTKPVRDHTVTRPNIPQS